MTTAYAPQNTPENRARLESIMRHRHSGQGRAAKSYNNLYDRSLREMFDEINAHGGLVCSDSVRGYWWAESLEDGLPAARQKIARSANIIESGRVLERNILDAYGGQLSLLGDQ